MFPWVCRNQAFFKDLRSKQNKRNHGNLLVEIGMWETYTKFQQKAIKFMVARARQSFQFFRQNTWVLENSGNFSKYFSWHFGLLN